MNCLHCKKEFHVCSNCCSIDYGWEHNYCCKECWKESNEYNNSITNFIKFIDSLTVEQRDYVKFKFITQRLAEYKAEFLKIIQRKEIAIIL